MIGTVNMAARLNDNNNKKNLEYHLNSISFKQFQLLFVDISNWDLFEDCLLSQFSDIKTWMLQKFVMERIHAKYLSRFFMCDFSFLLLDLL